MRLRLNDHLTILSCTTGLLIVAVALVLAFSGRPIPEALPMLATGIMGFEAYFVLSAMLRRRAGGGTNA